MIDDTLYDAFGQRQVSTIFTQLNQYRVVLEVDARLPAAPDGLDATLRRAAPTAARCRSAPSPTSRRPRRRCRSTTRASSPRHALVQPRARRRRSATAVRAVEEALRGDRPAGRASAAASRAPRRRSTPSLANEPLLILAALVTVYIVLGVLYESYIHPITILSTLPSAGVGALLALLLCGTDLSVIALIGIILLIGIVKKNAIMMIDFALEAERNEGKSPDGGDLRGLPAALPADHDDHHGGAARRAAAGARPRRRRRAAPAARHRHRRRPARQPGADALHHAGHLPRLRPPGARAWRAAERAEPPTAGRGACRAEAADEHLRALHPPAGRDDAADRRRWRWRASSASACCRWRRCRRSTSRPSRCRRRCPARARRPWRRRWRRRSSASSAASPASPR